MALSNFLSLSHLVRRVLRPMHGGLFQELLCNSTCLRDASIGQCQCLGAVRWGDSYRIFSSLLVQRNVFVDFVHVYPQPLLLAPLESGSCATLLPITAMEVVRVDGAPCCATVCV
jgi:hypothetical protein